MPYTLQFPLSNCACFSNSAKKVIILGGGFSSGFSLDVQEIDIETGARRRLDMMTEGRDLRNKIVVFNNKAFCVGGYNFKAEALDLRTESWS